jgi:LDH2 family malate/lactate/ureidoglycolate dehydrogenase
MEAQKIYVNTAKARRFVEDVLVDYGAPASTAAHVAKYLVAADVRGVDAHGMHRIPSYMEWIRRGVLDPKIELKLM